MLFTGTLRHNLDPFKAYTDGRIKRHGGTREIHDQKMGISMGTYETYEKY